MKRFLLSLVLVATTATAYATPAIQRWTTDNGVPVYFMPAPEIPMFKLRVVFDAGSARDRKSAGLAMLTSALLGEGTVDLSTDDFHAQVEATGAQIGSGVLRDMAWISLRSLTDPTTAEPALQLLRAMLVSPRFSEDIFDRARKQIQAGLQNEKVAPEALGDKALQRAIYHAHPYGTPTGGTETSIAGLAPADVQAFHARYYTTSNAIVVIVGALSPQQARLVANEIVEGLPVGEPAPALPEVTELSEGSDEHIPLAGQQSHLFYGQVGIKRKDPDYFSLVVGNHVLGGNATSILFNEIREKRGLSYSVSSYFEPMAERGPFLTTLQVDSARLTEARAVLEETLAKFIEVGPTRAQLDAAKRNLIGSFPLRIDNNSKLLEYLTVIAFYRLPLDYLESYPRSVAAVTLAEVKDAFKRRIALGHMARITVGPLAVSK
ncbi:MAG: insulinase family protein [Gammaproteobacteria bacterium]|nr:insulinase family protein [Gammaproteobacteria bacterium]